MKNDWVLNEFFSPSFGIPVVGLIQEEHLASENSIPDIWAKLFIYFSKICGWEDAVVMAFYLVV
jgi:hypothetical protein